MRGQEWHACNFLQKSCFGAIWVKITYFIISGSALRISFKLCSLTSYYKKRKVACFSFSKKSCFGINGQVGPVLGQNVDPFWGKSMPFIITVSIRDKPGLVSHLLHMAVSLFDKGEQSLNTKTKQTSSHPCEEREAPCQVCLSLRL